MQRILEGSLPAIFFLYFVLVLTMGGLTLMASTLPIFTMAFAVFGAWVFLRGSLEKVEKDTRLKNRK